MKLRYFLYGILAGMAYTLVVTQAFGASGRLEVAVLDSGFSAPEEGIPLCAPAEPDLALRRHGSNVAGLIAREAGASSGYCLRIFRVFSLQLDGTIKFDANAYLTALLSLQSRPPFAVNLSLGGGDRMPFERTLLEILIKQGTIIVAAAGNDGRNLEADCYYYPACLLPEIRVIGSRPGLYSNYGPQVDEYVDGNEQTAAGVTMTGTSQAAAIYTGRLIRAQLGKR